MVFLEIYANSLRSRARAKTEFCDAKTSYLRKTALHFTGLGVSCPGGRTDAIFFEEETWRHDPNSYGI